MKPSFYAPAIIGIGALLLVFAKSQKKKTVGEIMIGLGLLFIGLDFMSGSINPYTDVRFLRRPLRCWAATRFWA